jgi:hypothetical protein
MQTKDGDSWKDRLSVVYDEDAGEFDILFNGKLSLTSTAHLATNAAMGEAIAQVLSDAETYADGVGAAIELSVAATYETKTAAAQLLLDAKSYADGAVSSLSASIASNYVSNSAGADLLASAESYADSAVSSLAATVESTYETKTAAAQLLLDAKSYADGIVSSASASLSASIGDVSASLSLFASYADGQYASYSSLSAGTINFKADKNIFFNLSPSVDCNVLFGNAANSAYGGIKADPLAGSMRIGFFSPMSTAYLPYFSISPDNNWIFAVAEEFNILGQLLVNNQSYGTSLPAHDSAKTGRVFFKIT